MIVRSETVGPFAMNCWILGDPATREGFIVDPGDEIDSLLEIVAAEKLNLKWILNTHAHIDHVAGVAEFKRRTGLPFYLHRDDRFWVEALPRQAAMFGLPAPEVPGIDHELKEGDRFRIGALETEVIHVPGHSPGHVCFWFPSERLVIGGDVLFAGSIGRTDLPGGDHDLLIDGIRRKILPLGDDVRVCPGHGPETTVGEERKHNPFLTGNVFGGLIR